MEMKTYSIGVFDNDYPALIKKVMVNANSRDAVEEWCRRESWSGHSYIIIAIHEPAYSNVDLTLEVEE